jgi:L-ascorbate metabolism protein UlaG (beta-lactamase superfamily)
MKFQNLFFSLFALVFSISAQANPSGKTTITWWGHATFQILTPAGTSIVIDPWLSNPMNPEAAKGSAPDAAIKAVGKCDYILVTHGHFDHLADAVALAKATHAKLVTTFELSQNMVKILGFPKDQAGMDTMGNPGGEITIAGGDVKVNFTQAIHSSGLDSGKDTGALAYGGTPVGFVLQIKNGPTLYDTGDTAYFSDMKLIGEQFHPDLALINIGGHFGMEPAQAAEAAFAVKAKLTVPMHYKTFPVLTQSAEPFFKMLDRKHLAHLEMVPGKSIVYQGASVAK